MEIGFIDYSHEERNKILSTLKMLGEQNVLDELGIGGVRDAYSNILFPGISTLQTRAKYFVLIPYLFQSAKIQTEKGKIHSGRELLQWINEREDRLAASLTEKAKNLPEEVTGIIGSRAYQNRRSVKVKPSAIYWTGLRTFGIFRRENTYLPAACNLVFQEARQKTGAEIKIDGESFDDPTAMDLGSSLFLPITPDYDYEKDATMDLTKKEANFLSECIQLSPYSSGSLLAFCVKHRMAISDFKSVPVDLLPEGLRRDYQLAREFSRLIFGAHIRYNVISSEYTDQKVKDQFQEWRDIFLSEPIDLDPVLDRVSCPPALKGFCKAFQDTVRTNDTSSMDELIVRRELHTKKERAKLRKPQEYHYDPAHPIHLYELDYRFDRASVIIRDILKGLGGAQSV